MTAGRVERREPADAGFEGTPKPEDFPPAVVERRDTPPVTGAVEQLVSGGVESPVDAGPVDAGPAEPVAPPDDVSYGVLAGAGRRRGAMAAAGAVVATRTALGTGRGVSDRVFAGVPDVGGLAQGGARAATAAMARAVSGEGLANNRWGRFARFRMGVER